MSHEITLHSWAQAREALTSAAAWIKARTTNGRRVKLTLADEHRSTDQNALLHALLAEIAREREWAGKRRDIETWKRLLVASWCRARGEAVELLPALDGHGVDIVFRRTSKMTKAEVSELVDYIQAWRATR